MRFKDKKGNILVDIRIARRMYCDEEECPVCPLHGHGEGCDYWAANHPVEAAKLMGCEIIEDPIILDGTGVQVGSLKIEPSAINFNPTRESILEAAKRCVCGDREQDYGSPENNFRTIANLWIDYLAAKDCPLDIEPEDVAAMMMLLKIARIASGHAKEDSWVDAAGYAACGGELQGGRSE